MSKLFKKYLIVGAALVGVVGLVGMMSQEKASQEALVVGLQSGYPPFEFMDKKGNVVGFDIDVANSIATKLGRKLVIKDMEFEGEILALQQGKIDLIISGMNITPSRVKEIDMVPYHGEAATSLSLIFWEKIPQGVQSIEDLGDLLSATVSVEAGTIPESYMSHYPKIQAKSFHGALAPLMDVKYGKSMANLVEQDVAEYLKRQHPQIKILNVPLKKTETIAGFGIGVKKENQKLKNQLEHIIQELKGSGELKQLEEKWFKGKG